MIQCPACAASILDIDVRCPSCGEALASEEARRRVGTTVLDTYEVVDVLGQGGMSVVYRARHLLTDQEVALKILPPELAANAPGQVPLPRGGARAGPARSPQHRPPLQLRAGGRLLRPGDAVRRRADLGADDPRAQGRLDWQAVDRDRHRRAARARVRPRARRRPPRHEAVERAGPRPTARRMVMDFGIAKMTTSTRLTATGQTMGTVRYMSPEQVRGHEVDPAHRHLLAGGHAVRVAGRRHAVRRREPLRDHGGAPARRCRRRCRRTASRCRARSTALIMAGLSKDAGRSPGQRARDAQPAGRHPRPGADRGGGGALAGRAPGERALCARWSGCSWAGRRSRPRRVAAFLVARRAIARPRPPRLGERRAAARPQLPAWPAAHIVPGLEPAVDQRYDGDRLRVLSVARRDPGLVRGLVLAARRDFIASLPAQGVTARRRCTAAHDRHRSAVAACATSGSTSAARRRPTATAQPVVPAAREDALSRRRGARLRAATAPSPSPSGCACTAARPDATRPRSGSERQSSERAPGK